MKTKSRHGLTQILRYGLLISSIFFGLMTIVGTGGGGGGGESNSIPGQSGQEWHGISDEGGEVNFHVSDSKVEDFEILAYLTGGSSGSGWLWLAIEPEMPISGNSFSFSGTYFDVTGTFTDSTNCTGTWDYHDPYFLGYSRGTWTASFMPVLSVTPTYQDVTSSSGSTSFTVTNANEGAGTMSWTAETDPNDTWINIISGGSGTDTGTISVNYSENEGDARVGTITITSPEAYNSPQTVEIRQKDYRKLLASDGAVSDHFGRSVSISGDTAIVGATGSAYVFERTGSKWVQKAKLTQSDVADGAPFGGSVSISGDTAIVGAPGVDSGDGSAYIFEKPAEGWTDMTETAKLLPSDGGRFGDSVSISADTAIVGAPYDDDTGYSSGSAYIFEKPAEGWTDMTETAKLLASDGDSFDSFGRSVSISGDTIIVGSGDDVMGSNFGSVYIFEKPAEGWTDMIETAKLLASDGAGFDRFGGSVSISGDTIIVGAYADDDNGYSSGSAYIFEKPAEGWTDMTDTAKLVPSDGAAEDFFGYSVSISGDIAIVGAKGDDVMGSNFGSVYIFEKPVGPWTDMIETAKLLASDGSDGDSFGDSVSISGDITIVGAPNDDGSQANSGSAYIYLLED